MGLLSTSTSNKRGLALSSSKGFTLIEITVVMALFAMILSFGLITGFDSYRRDSLKSERNTVISLLQKARSQAINNIDDSKHGFYLYGTDYIVFSGDSFASRVQTRDLVVKKNSAITVNILNNIVFDQLTGNTVQPENIVLNDDISSATISINQEGQINW